MTATIDRDLVRALKGAPSTLLMQMLLLEADSGRTVQQALETLAGAALVQRRRRYHGWSVTDRARRIFYSAPQLRSAFVDTAPRHVEAHAAHLAGPDPQPSSPGGDLRVDGDNLQVSGGDLEACGGDLQQHRGDLQMPGGDLEMDDVRESPVAAPAALDPVGAAGSEREPSEVHPPHLEAKADSPERAEMASRHREVQNLNLVGHEVHLGNPRRRCRGRLGLLDHETRAHDKPTTTTTTNNTTKARHRRAPRRREHVADGPAAPQRGWMPAPRGGAPTEREADRAAPRSEPGAAPPLRGWDADAAEAVRRLCATGMPARSRSGKGNGARESVEVALAAGWTGRQVLDAVETWFAYGESEQGRTIRHPGFFTASRLRDQHPLPDLDLVRAASAPMTADERNRAFIAAAAERLVRR